MQSSKSLPTRGGRRRRPRAGHPSDGLQSRRSSSQRRAWTSTPTKDSGRQEKGLQSWGRGGAGCSLRFEGQDLAPTSTKASVRSLARSITGKWRPATIFTLSLPGIFSASASPWAPAETNKRVCAELPAGRGRGGSARGAAPRRERAG